MICLTAEMWALKVLNKMYDKVLLSKIPTPLLSQQHPGNGMQKVSVRSGKKYLHTNTK